MNSVDKQHRRLASRSARQYLGFLSFVISIALLAPPRVGGALQPNSRTVSGLAAPVAHAAQDAASADETFGVAKPVVWLLSLVVSALLTSYLKDRWEAPRPVLQITDFGVRSAEGEKASALIDPTLAHAITKHYYLPNLKLPITVGDLQQALNNYKSIRENVQGAEDFVERVISLIQSQGTGISLENRRKDFLQLLGDGDSSEVDVIENLVKIIVGRMEMDQQLDQKYQQHPVGTEALRVNLRAGFYDLALVDEEKMARDAATTSSDPNAYTRRQIDAHRTNLYRRVIIIYEPDLLLSIFKQVKDRLAAENRAADEIITKLSVSTASQAGRRIALQVLVSNRGQRPLPVRGLGLLRLEVPPAKSGPSIPVMIPMMPGSASDEMVVVEGGKASMLYLLSIESIEQLIQANAAVLGGDGWSSAKPLDDSRLLLLFKAQTAEITASVALVRAGEQVQKGKIGPSAPLPVSESAAERAIDEIKRTWS